MPPTSIARVLRRDEAAQYLGFRSDSSAFDNYIHRLGVRPLEGRKGCYDMRALDLALNKESGIDEREELTDAEKWLRDHDNG